MGVGLALEYHFPNGPTLIVRLFELFSPEMIDVLRFYVRLFGRPTITEPNTDHVRSVAA
jgi:hypothetical protein